MIELRGDLDFAQEAQTGRLGFAQFAGQLLERDVAQQLDIAGDVDRGHAAATGFADDHIADPRLCARRRLRGGRCGQARVVHRGRVVKPGRQFQRDGDRIGAGTGLSAGDHPRAVGIGIHGHPSGESIRPDLLPLRRGK